MGIIAGADARGEVGRAGTAAWKPALEPSKATKSESLIAAIEAEEAFSRVVLSGVAAAWGEGLRQKPSFKVIGSRKTSLRKAEVIGTVVPSKIPAMRSTVLALLAALAFASAAVPQLGVVPSKQRTAAVRSPLAVVIPGDSLAEAVLVDGSVNFLSIYGGVLTLRIRARLPPEHTGQRTHHSNSPAPAPHTRSAHPLRTPTPCARSSLSNLGYD